MTASPPSAPAAQARPDAGANPNPGSNPGPGRPRGFDADDALRAAMEVFWRKGFEASSLEDLTAAMGLSRSSFYACFGSKHGALVAAVRAYARDRKAALKALLDAAPDAEARIDAAVEALAPTDGARRGCFLGNCATELAPHDPEIAEISRAHLADLEAIVAAALTGLPPEQAASRARALMALSLGVATLGKAGAPPETLASVAHEARRLLAS